MKQKPLVIKQMQFLKGTIGLNHEDSQKIPVDEQPERGALITFTSSLQYLC